MQLACEALGGQVQADPAAASTAGPSASVLDAAEPALPRRAPRDDRLDEPRRPGPGRRATTSSPLAATPPARSPPSGTATRPIYGLQFHPEVTHTPYGTLILGNFLDRICGNPRTWTMGAFIERSVDRGPPPGRPDRPGGLRAVRRRRFGGLRGPAGQGPRARASSASSSTTACSAPASARAVAEAFARASNAELRVVDAAEPFLAALTGVTDPQEKRVRIGHTFIDVFRDEARSIPGARFLAQGTLYPDVIESGGEPDGPAATIKLHHNVGGLPDRAGLRADRAAARPVQGRGPPAGPGAGPARRAGLAPPVPRPRPGRPLPGRGDAPSGWTCSARPTPSSSTSSRTPASTARSPRLRRAAAGAGGRRDGRRPHLRERRRPPRRRDRRLHDRRLVAAAARPAGHASPPGSSTRSRASTASSTTSPASRRGRSSGSRAGSPIRTFADAR